MMWKDIEGYEGLYKVSDTGQVMSFKREPKELKQWKRSCYKLVDLWKDGVRDVRSVHVLVYEAFKGKTTADEVVHHKDGNKFNNNLDNLVKITVLEHNRLHHGGKEPWNKGKSMPAEVHKKVWETRHNQSKPRNDAIKQDWADGLSAKELSAKYSICTRQIYTILRGE